MVKRTVSMAVLVIFLLSLGLSASARWEDPAQCTATLAFSRNTATCSASIVASDRSATVTASMALYRVNSNGSLSNCATWPSKTGTESIFLDGSYSRCVSGNTYRLIISGTVKDSTGTHSFNTYRQATCP